MNLNRARFYLILVICLALIVNTVRSIGDLYHGGDRVTMAKLELAKLQARHKELIKENEQVQSADYVEKIARDKLGMSKPGETVIILPENLQQEPVSKQVVEVPNWEKWKSLIF